MTSALPAGIRGIVLRIRDRLLKKAARHAPGRESRELATLTGDTELSTVTADIRDASGEVVARAREVATGSRQ
jgi:hypothetical protein